MPGKGEETRQILKNKGFVEKEQFLLYYADASKPEEIQKMVDYVVQKEGKIDIVISNAYFSERAPFLGKHVLLRKVEKFKTQG